MATRYIHQIPNIHHGNQKRILPLQKHFRWEVILYDQVSDNHDS